MKKTGRGEVLENPTHVHSNDMLTTECRGTKHASKERHAHQLCGFGSLAQQQWMPQPGQKRENVKEKTEQFGEGLG